MISKFYNIISPSCRAGIMVTTRPKMFLFNANHYFIKKFCTQNDNDKFNYNEITPISKINMYHNYDQKYSFGNDINEIILNRYIKCLEESSSKNETIYILSRISEIAHQLKSTLNTSQILKIQEKINQIKIALQNDRPENLMICTFAQALSRFSFINDQELWLIIGDCIVDDRFLSSFEESLRGLEGLIILSSISHEEYFDKIFSKLEQTCYFSEEFEELPNIIRISRALSLKSSRAKFIFERIEFLVSTKYLNKMESSDIIDIAFKLSYLGILKPKFLERLQKIFIQELRDKKKHSPNKDRRLIVRLIELYSLQFETTLDYQREFLDLVENNLLSGQNDYSFKEIISILARLHAFSFPNEEEIYKNLKKKLFLIEENFNLIDVIEFYDLISQREYQNKHDNIPISIHDHFDSRILKKIQSVEANMMYYYMSECNRKGMMPMKKLIMQELIYYILDRLRDHEPEQLYEYYTLYDVYSYHLEGKKIEDELTRLQEFIRIVSEVPAFG